MKCPLHTNRCCTTITVTPEYDEDENDEVEYVELDETYTKTIYTETHTMPECYRDQCAAWCPTLNPPCSLLCKQV